MEKRGKTLLVASGLTTSNKKLLVTKGTVTRSRRTGLHILLTPSTPQLYMASEGKSLQGPRMDRGNLFTCPLGPS